MAINWSEAGGVLAEEKAFAESGAGLLKSHVAQDLRGQMLYAEAKAASDGLLARFLVVLAEGREPARADDLKAAAETAFVARLAFSEHVKASLPDLTGARAIGPEALLKPVGDLIKGLIDGGIAIWKEHRRGDEVRRQGIATRIETYHWRRFDEI